MAKEQARIWLIVLLSISLLPFFQSTTTPPIDTTSEEVYEEVKEHETKRDRDEDGGWSDWSSWSVCSRSCNGGVTYQLRKCERKAGCLGEAAKYKICNMQPCPDSQDFRASQCAAYNPMPYRGRLYEWLPYQDPEDPCSLTCHARNFSFVAKLSSAVRDGTRCREGSLDMCVNGRCLAVGCDLQLGSTKKVDECGVCGGDGSTCRRPLYLWLNTPFSPCSVTCGGGYQMSRPTCLNKATGKEVDERLCDVTSRSPPEIRECNTQRCPAIWVTDSWSPCSASCGGGRQSRQVYCAQMGTDGIRSPTAVSQCLRQKPLTERPCNLLPCPQWISGPWSGCSVTCGLGLKTRSVGCRDAKAQHSEDCDIEGMPATKQSCDSGLVCTPSKDPGTYLFSDIFKGSQEDAPPPAPLHSQPWTQRRIGSSTSSTEPSYVAGKWSPCTVTCGQGSRTRDVDCRIFLEFSKTDAKLPDKECPGPRPNDVEHCFPRPCALDQNKPDDNKIPLGQEGIDVTYTWRMGGYTPCSASCLGGIRESIIQCFRDHDQAIVSPYKCDIRKKPDAITQTCNDHPCPPRWNVSEFSPCSKHCGGGFQLRDIQCLHEVTRGAANTLVISNSLCPQPPPTSKLLCNVFDCPTKWRTEAWMKCSKSCGGGEKMRKIRCVRELAFGQVVELDPSKCSKRRPKTVKVCNNKPCPPADEHVDDGIVPSHQTYVQKHPQRRVFLKVGGSAIVFAGTSLKIRCPNKKSNKTNVLWYKDEEKLKPSRRVKVSMKGALRIRRIAYGDSGKYTCSTGYSTADIHITVKPLPPGSGRSEDEKTVERPEAPTDTKPPLKSPGQEYSHETYHTSREDNKSHFSNQPHQRENSPIASQEHPRAVVPENKPRTVDHSYDFGSTERIPMYVLAGRQPAVTGPPVDIHMFSTSSTRTSSTTGINSQRSRDEEKNQNNSRFRTKSKSNPKYHRPSEDKMVTSASPLPPNSWEHQQQGTQSPEAADSKPYDSWGRNHGENLFSDQESGELNIGTPHGDHGSFPILDAEQPARSGASSNHAGSHIQKILVNLHHTLGGSRVTNPDVHDSNGDDDEVGDVMNPSRLMANSFVLGKGKPENLKFDWVITDWSPCSQSCGGNGFQVRECHCLVRLNNVSKTVDNRLCEDYGLHPPITVQACGTDDCPHWQTGPWFQCLEAHCFSWHSSYQKREIYCRMGNGTQLPHFHCDDKTRPRRKRECYNERCRSMWSVGEWSECTAACSRQGFQTRILQCVWYGSRKPAGNACHDQPRPSVMRPCIGPTCQSKEDCIDRSSYCSLAKTLHMCRLTHYQHQCCDSCREEKA